MPKPSMTLRKDVRPEEARREILEFIANRPGSDSIDIARGLRLPWQLVSRITEQLQTEGMIQLGYRTREN